MKIRTYSELMRFNTFEDRFKYLMNKHEVGSFTFNGKRHLNQNLYLSKDWRDFRRDIILRDHGLDLAHPDHVIFGTINVHHINGLDPDDIYYGRIDKIFNPETVITVSSETHKAIEFGNESYLMNFFVQERRPGDTIPWR